MEILPSVVSANDSHKTSKVDYINWDLAMNLNKMLDTNLYFISCEDILNSGPEENDERETFSQFTGNQ